MKRIQKTTVKQPRRLQAPKLSPLSSSNLSKEETSREIRRKIKRSTELPGGEIANQPKLAVGYYVYTIGVAGVVRYIGKGKGPRLYSHMKEVRSRLKRDFRIQSIGSILQRNLTKAFLSGAQVAEQVLLDDLTEKAAYKLEYDKMREFVFAGKRDQLWNVIPDSIQTPEEIQAAAERLQRYLKDSRFRTRTARTSKAQLGKQDQHRTEP